MVDISMANKTTALQRSSNSEQHQLLGYKLVCLVLRVCVLLLCFATPALVSANSLIVLDFELHDLTLNPDLEQETERTATLRPLLVERLSGHHGMEVIENPPRAVTEAEKGAGYLFDRPTVSGGLGKEVNADWVVTGRLHKASFLFVYLRAQLIDPETGTIAADFVVEIKGPQKKLTKKGVESLALQIFDTIQTLRKQ